MALHVRAVTLFLLLAAATALADQADLSVRLTAPEKARPGLGSSLQILVDNAGPDTARDIVVTVRLDGQPLPPQQSEPCNGGRCTLGNMGPGRQRVLFVNTTLPKSGDSVVWNVEVAGSTPDPNAENNVRAAMVLLSTEPFMTTYLTAPDWVDPGMEFPVDLIFGYDNVAVAHNVVGSIELPAGTGIVSLPPACSAPVPTRIDCAAGGDVFETPPQDRLHLRLRAPARFGGETLTLTTTVRMRETNFQDLSHDARITLSRSFVVTTTADGGGGSLRTAIDAANASCRTALDRCAIVFKIEEPSAKPWKTIRVASPLPPLLSPSLHVDGSTQIGLAGGGNPDGPSIEITGGGEVDGDGLIALGCFQTIANLSINGFRRFGIFSAENCGGFSLFTGNFIGVDPTGTTAVPNLRGIVTMGRKNAAIRMNTISGNVRSGIFVLDGKLWITDNRIGVAAHADTPLPNGASGIYVGPNTQQFAVIDYNVIAFNHEFGIAIDGATKWAGGQSNRIWGNGGIAVDDALDGPSPDVLTTRGRMATPVITSATFDPATGTTTIRGSASAPGPVNGVNVHVDVYAADAAGLFGSGESQRYLGQIQPGDFEMKVRGDLRGQWVSATTVLIDYTVSEDGPTRMTELSRAVQVR
jgi:hypothetical protein